MTIPDKEYNHMKGRVESTSTPEWQQYYLDLKAHEEKMEARKPKREDYRSDSEYNSACSEWHMAFFCDAPNKPGYYRANND